MDRLGRPLRFNRSFLGHNSKMMTAQSPVQRLLVCLVTGLVCGSVFARMANKFLPFPPVAAYGIGIFILIGFLASAFFWRDRSHVFVVGALRYAIAFDLAMFGFQKIFHMQFNVPLGMLDEPFNDISSKWLMWAFFRRSYGFVYTIAATQILGASLLLFNRTRLVSLVLLVPVMLNIVLIDVFYELERGVLVHALFLSAGLIYLLLLDYRKLVACFLDKDSTTFSMPWRNDLLKYAGRLSIIVIPLLLIMSLGPRDKHPGVTGKYTVTASGGDKLLAPKCDSVLTRVYFDFGNDCVFEFNGLDKRMFGTFNLDDRTGTLTTKWHYPKSASDKSFSGVLKRIDDDEVELSGVMNKDSIRVKLKKARG